MWNLKASGCARGVILAGVVMGVSGRVGADTDVSSTWDGSSGNNWSNSAHWLPAGLPTNGFGFDYFVGVNGGQVTMDIPVQVSGLTVRSGAEVDSGAGLMLTVSGLTNNGLMNMDVLKVNGDVSNGGILEIGNGGNATITGNFTNTGSVITNSTGTGNNTFTINGALVNDGSSFEVDTGTFAGVGSLTLENGSLIIQQGATLEVLGMGGTFGNLITDVPAGEGISMLGVFTVLVNVPKSGVQAFNGLSGLSTVEGTVAIGTPTGVTQMSSLTVSSTGFVVLENGTTVTIGTLTNGGTVLTNFFGSAGTTLTVSTLNNQAGGNFTIDSGDTASVGVLNNAGTVTVQRNGQDFPKLNGSGGTMVLGAVSVSIDGGTSTNFITDNGAGGTLIAGGSGSVQTGTVRVGTLELTGFLTINTPKVASKVSTLTFEKGGQGSGVQLLLGTPLVVEGAGAGHGALILSLKSEVQYGQTHNGLIYDSSLGSGQVMVVSDFGVTDGSTPARTSFDGVSVDAGSVVVMPTWLGDANMDGVVDIVDLTAVANHWQGTVTDWRQGDFDGSDFVDIVDLTRVANNWQAGAGSGGGSSFGEALGEFPAFGGTGSVPEPGTVGVMGLGVICGVVRRRRA